MAALITAGLSNQEIAEHLTISVATAKAHVARLLTKLSARDRVQLVIAATKPAWSPPGTQQRALTTARERPPAR